MNIDAFHLLDISCVLKTKKPHGQDQDHNNGQDQDHNNGQDHEAIVVLLK